MTTAIVWFALGGSFLIALSFHEMAHAWAAARQGDTTATARQTLNPLRHIDFFGTLVLPAICIASGWPAIGWAKPVPIDATRFRQPRIGLALVALAGPLMNVLLTVLTLLILRFAVRASLDGESLIFGNELALLFARLNLSLAAFNLLPVPPLDGYHVLSAALPTRLQAQLARLSQVFSLALFALVLSGRFPLSPFVGRLFGTFARWIL